MVGKLGKHVGKCLDANVAKFVLTPFVLRNLESYVDFILDYNDKE